MIRIESKFKKENSVLITTLFDGMKKSILKLNFPAKLIARVRKIIKIVKERLMLKKTLIFHVTCKIVNTSYAVSVKKMHTNTNV